MIFQFKLVFDFHASCLMWIVPMLDL